MLPIPPLTTRRTVEQLSPSQLKARGRAVVLLNKFAKEHLDKLGGKEPPGDHETRWNTAIRIMRDHELSKYEVVACRSAEFGLDLLPRFLPDPQGGTVMCNRCELRKPASCFYVKRDMRGGAHSWCIECHDKDKSERVKDKPPCRKVRRKRRAALDDYISSFFGAEVPEFEGRR